MKLKTKLYFILLLAALLAGIMLGCTGKTPEEHHQPQEQLAAFHLNTEQPVDGSTPAFDTCILDDITISMSRASTARSLRLEDVMLLIEHVDTHGGSIALGHISETTGPLKTLRLPPPERDEPPPASDVFTRNKQMREYEAARPERAAREAERREENQIRIKDFVQHDLKTYLAAPQNGRITNLWDGLRRCELHLLQNAEYWTRTTGARPKASIVVRTDGLHDAEDVEFTSIDSSIPVLAITGSADARDLDNLDPPPRLFESPTSAFLFITSHGGSNHAR